MLHGQPLGISDHGNGKKEINVSGNAVDTTSCSQTANHVSNQERKRKNEKGGRKNGSEMKFKK